MNSEIKILFYILIGVGYLFVTFFRKAMKQQKEKQVNKRPVSSKTSEEIFRELQKSLKLPGHEQPKDIKPAPRIPLKKIVEQRPIPAPTSHRPLKTSIQRSGSQVKEKIKISSAQQQAPSAPSMAETMDFDPRKAVIFSEIIKRPQF